MVTLLLRCFSSAQHCGALVLATGSSAFEWFCSPVRLAKAHLYPLSSPPGCLFCSNITITVISNIFQCVTAHSVILLEQYIDKEKQNMQMTITVKLMTLIDKVTASFFLVSWEKGAPFNVVNFLKISGC